MRNLMLLALLGAVACCAEAQLLGGINKVDKLSEKENEIVDFAFSQLTGTVEDKCGLKKVDVENFSKQVVSGLLYRFDLVVTSKCDGKQKRCSLVVYDQPWTETREVQWDKVKCQRNDNDDDNVSK
eukprot:TRINITY_DN8058_c0_g1_i1.p1 TRINITY_DN8058_c0_g1~~TRINITY_DN8058_c0_g1_i1.p1  ORF type:complete len:126 (+),score=34.74 TRINITY_DN8058_c0_g1_i1:50-427(+)